MLKNIEFKRIWLFIVAIFGIGLQAVMALSSPALRLFNDIPAFIGYLSLALLLLEIPLVRLIADIISSFSYELYLVHMGVFSIMFVLLKPESIMKQVMVGCLALAVSLILGYLYHMLVKKVKVRVR